jgi:hypothetical protein
MEEKYWRVRFYANADDYRPVKFPPPGPYWCSGYTDDSSVMIAYLPKKSDLHEYWPEALVDEWYGQEPIEFTDRFSKPDWWRK